ncbi:oxygenase MpaB family protein [Kitasatospora sp. MAP5-34]|uniref:oxygenase MpaB family protein n=1 Tax=Kitasatospora sp. MAP5-34 TaxID=3035102 RepID=UPI002476BA09|nr:oxygenase MpaB family protein [Kitasatospora sp. MAP5-34]MDH6577426.1 uncharacterized protein (DUF2236 family) [Kitasatospora sp. MAP5-34]
MSEREAPAPLGPSSLTWRYFGDWRGMALALWAGSLQNMHPGLGAGVEEHSGFLDERWERLHRSLYPIYGVVYDGPNAVRTARAVRGYHDLVKGVDRQGRPYHALDPDTFYWAHATFFMSTVVLADRLAGGLTVPQKRQLYGEQVQWYALYGMSMRPVPPDWEAFERYWDHMCAEVLEDNRAARAVLDIGRIGRPPALSWLPEPLWALLRPLVVRPFVWLTVGLYPPAVRERLGHGWTPADERRLRLLARLADAGWRLLPHDRRFHPRARAGWQRAAGRRPDDSPPVETPARNLPPVGERDDPRHYTG